MQGENMICPEHTLGLLQGTITEKNKMVDKLLWVTIWISISIIYWFIADIRTLQQSL